MSSENKYALNKLLPFLFVPFSFSCFIDLQTGSILSTFFLIKKYFLVIFWISLESNETLTPYQGSGLEAGFLCVVLAVLERPL